MAEMPPAADMIAFINERYASGRWVTCAMALAKARQWLEAIPPDQRLSDERTWPKFVRKHFKFSLKHANELLERIGVMPVCPRCGRPFRASSTAIEMAIAAIEAHRSDREIAKQIGVSHATVNRARKLAQQP